MTRFKPDTQSGFSLTEVLVAFLIVSLSMIGIYQAVILSSKSIYQTEIMDEALNLARQEIAALSVRRPFELGTFKGMSEDDRFRWTADIDLYRDSRSYTSSATLLVMIEVSVVPEVARAQPATIKARTLRLIPRAQFKKGAV